MLSFLKKKLPEPSTPYTLKAFASGKVIPMEEVKDPVFSGKMLGDGLAIEPTDEYIFAPCDGVITSVNTSKGSSVESGALLCVIQ